MVFGWDAADLCYEKAGIEITGWHSGYPDAGAFIDHSTFRSVPWDDNIPFFIADFNSENNNDFYACPRTLLKQVAKKCDEIGFYVTL